MTFVYENNFINMSDNENWAIEIYVLLFYWGQ